MTTAKICFVVSSPLTARAFLSGHIAALSQHYAIDLAATAIIFSESQAGVRKSCAS